MERRAGPELQEEDSLILRAAVIALSLCGLADSFYFTFAYYGRIKRSRWVPEVLCAREESSCVRVVQTPFGRVFGIPNSLLGILYYVLMMIWAMAGRPISFEFQLGTMSYSISFTNVLIALGAMTVVLGFYLTYALRRILRVDCPFCCAAHAINLLLLVLLAVAR